MTQNKVALALEFKPVLRNTLRGFGKNPNAVRRDLQRSRRACQPRPRLGQPTTSKPMHRPRDGSPMRDDAGKPRWQLPLIEFTPTSAAAISGQQQPWRRCWRHTPEQPGRPPATAQPVHPARRRGTGRAEPRPQSRLACVPLPRGQVASNAQRLPRRISGSRRNRPTVARFSGAADRRRYRFLVWHRRNAGHRPQTPRGRGVVADPLPETAAHPMLPNQIRRPASGVQPTPRACACSAGKIFPGVDVAGRRRIHHMLVRRRPAMPRPVTPSPVAPVADAAARPAPARAKMDRTSHSGKPRRRRAQGRIRHRRRTQRGAVLGRVPLR